LVGRETVVLDQTFGNQTWVHTKVLISVSQIDPGASRRLKLNKCHHQIGREQTEKMASASVTQIEREQRTAKLEIRRPRRCFAAIGATSFIWNIHF
jgi:hypothetical protein